MDKQRRRLERRQISGDLESQQRLEVNRCRSGQCCAHRRNAIKIGGSISIEVEENHDYLVESEVRVAEYNPRTGAMHLIDPSHPLAYLNSHHGTSTETAPTTAEISISVQISGREDEVSDYFKTLGTLVGIPHWQPLLNRCDYCGANSGEFCITKSGRKTEFHMARWTSSGYL